MDSILNGKSGAYEIFSIWVFFYEHSQITGQHGKGLPFRAVCYYFNSSLPLPPASHALRH